MSEQANWRFCEHCNVLFYDGNPEKGRCAGSILTGHVAQGYDFILSTDLPETPTLQANWRCCSKCDAMFYDLFPDKGHCPAGGAHVASPNNYSIPHEVAPTATSQAAWRFCKLCSSMFYDGRATKGPCAGAATFRTAMGDHHGPHESAGFDFVLPFQAAPAPAPTARIPVSVTGPVWVVSLTHGEAEAVEGLSGSVGGVLGAIAVIPTPGTPITNAVAAAVAGALALASGYIQVMDSLGGDQGVDVQGVIGTRGVIVTPHASGMAAELIQAARIGVAAETIADFLIAASAKLPALANGLGIGTVASAFALWQSGTPLGWAVAAGAGMVADLTKSAPDINQHGGVHADKTKVGPSERFILSQVGPQNQVALLAWQGLFSAQNGGGDDVYANRPQLGPWETWTLCDNTDGTVSFKSQNGHYLVATNAGGDGSVCRANSPQIGNWERFVIDWQKDGHIALKTFARGAYVSVQSGK